MRVISGKFRGRRLSGPQGLEIRPTGDRLKETLFNILGNAVCGAVVLDVFGGSGAIGIEALSRGAREAVFVEKSPSACRLIRRNAELCGIAGGFRVIQQDVFMALRGLAREGFKADIVFFDPPYDFQPYEDLLEITFQKNLVGPASSVVVEHHRKAGLPEAGKGFRRRRVIRQGDHRLSFYDADGVLENEQKNRD